jgi:hypothetical protein
MLLLVYFSMLFTIIMYFFIVLSAVSVAQWLSRRTPVPSHPSARGFEIWNKLLLLVYFSTLFIILCIYLLFYSLQFITLSVF